MAESGGAPRTEYHKERHCCCEVAVIEYPNAISPGKKRYFWRHWEIRPIPLFVVPLPVLFCLAVYWAAVFPGMGTGMKVASVIEIHLFAVLFLVAFYMTMFLDPGFLAYNWSETQKEDPTWEEQLTYLAITPAQLRFVEEHEAPKRACFSRTAGRFILRGDHMSDIAGNWVGKRNHKQFLLMLCYCTLLCASLFVWRFYPDVSSKSRSSVLYGFDITACIIEIVFGIICFGFGAHHFVNLYDGLTEIDMWKAKRRRRNEIERDDANKSSCDNFREVFGDDMFAWWICPCRASWKKDEEKARDQEKKKKKGKEKPEKELLIGSNV